jgi:periplasmic copper chaperone A
MKAVLAEWLGRYDSDKQLETTMIAAIRVRSSFAILLGLLLVVIAESASAAGRLVVEQPWIRAAPPGAMMLAGYAQLKNAGDVSIVISNVVGSDFGSVSMHETIDENGVSKMRPLDRVEIAPGATLTFAPGGKHFMLMRPQRELKNGDAVKIAIATSANSISVEFVVRDSAP